MIKKQLRLKFLTYILLAVMFSAALAIVSFFFYSLGLPLQTYLIFLAVFFGALGVAVFFMFRDMKNIVVPIQKISAGARDITKGLPVVPYVHNEDNEIAELADSVGEVLKYINGRIEILDRINEGDYSIPIEPVGWHDQLTQAIIGVVETNSKILRDIKEASREINSVSNEVANNAQTLASGTAQQAATVEEFAAAMNEVQGMAENNAEIANQTLIRAENSMQLSKKSNAEIGQMAEAMEAINASSRRIETVIKVIDEIAFQTNILALNAAVEAARAGVHGRGFAVVADEVRELASKSAAAANETAELIQMSIRAISEGNGIMRISAEGLSNVGADAEQASVYMISLKESSEHQRAALSEINYGVSQISNVIQSNSALAQHNAVSAELMAAQSEHLEHLVTKYKLRDE